jgi:hypothetical protein
MMIPDVITVRSTYQRVDDLSVAMAEVERPPVQVEVVESVTVDIPEEIALPSVDDKRNTRLLPESNSLGSHMPRVGFEDGLLPSRGHRAISPSTS